MLNVRDVEGGIELEVIVKPGARKEGIVGVHDGALRIAVTAPPEKSQANTALIKLLSKCLRVPASAINIITGVSSRRKRIRIDGVTSQDIVALVREGTV